MAELLDFPIRSEQKAQAYELHRFSGDGQVRTKAFISALNNADAQYQARQMTEGLYSELWSKGQLVEVLAPGDHPIVDLISEVRPLPDA